MARIPFHLARAATLGVAGVLALFLAGCDGSSSKTGSVGTGGNGTLRSVQFGRLVDVYAFRRVDPARPERRDTRNRAPALIARDVVIGPDIATEPLFDSAGRERPDANYRFLPFDVDVGHDELLILWDDRLETDRFDAALRVAKASLQEVAPAYRDQNTIQKPIPVVPRNAAFVLNFESKLGVDTAFFQANPGAIQLLQFRADPKTNPPQAAYNPVVSRVIAAGDNRVILDTTLIGSESNGGLSSTGMPLSLDNVTANLRIAIPINGAVSRAFVVKPDPVTQLNGVDSLGNAAVIRDFRSGNLKDGAAAALADTEAPMVVAEVVMGIIAVDPVNRVLTLNKRFAELPLRGRIPFVDGALIGDSASALPGGPPSVPTESALRAGDVITQTVATPNGGLFRLRAEIVANLEVKNAIVNGELDGIGLTPAGNDGAKLTTVRLQVASITQTALDGNIYSFQANDTPLGADCKVRGLYYDRIPYSAAFGNAEVSDATRRTEFLAIEPPPPLLDENRQVVPKGTRIAPVSSIGIRFSEPLDLATVGPLDNYMLTNEFFRDDNVAVLAEQPKDTGLSVLLTRLIDVERNGTLLRLTPPVGHFHEKAKTETYWVHALVDDKGPRDLAGNLIDLFSRTLDPIDSFSVKYTLDTTAEDNLAAWKVWRFDSPDEDGTAPGSTDYYGQFQLRDGAIFGADTTRRSQVADNQSLGGILTNNKGDVWFPGDPTAMPPIPPGDLRYCYNPYNAFAPGAFPRYQTPSMVTVQQAPPAVFLPPNTPRLFGGVIEPHNARGSRLQMTYREDDFGLGYHDASTYAIDIEQMHWAPWNNNPLQFDVFDRYTVALGHSDWRPDLRFEVWLPPRVTTPCAGLECSSLFSGLRPGFADNVLRNSTMTEVVVDKGYTINPNDTFRAATGTVFIPYPKFERTMTWRDSRIVSWDMENDRVLGLGGAKQPDGTFPAQDKTVNVSSPWTLDFESFVTANPPTMPANFTGLIWNQDDGDFHGNRVLDFDPIALPLLVDFKVYPDDPRNGIANGVNESHIAYVGPIWTPVSPGGYYNAAPEPSCAPTPYPIFRTHTSGGIDGLGNQIVLDIPRTTTAFGGWIKDAGLGDPIQGRYQSPPGDDHLHWAQIDLVRRVSLVTLGFFDSLQPNQHGLTAANYSGSTWPGLTRQAGIPDFVDLQNRRTTNYGISDVVTVMDPPPAQQPAGTRTTVEFRFAETIANAKLYKPLTVGAETGDDKLATRGNLLNSHYACDAYRCATPNAGADKTTPRVAASGLTPYVLEERLDSVRDAQKGTLPRYMNLRFVFENNISVTPALSPGLRSFGVCYRMKAIE